MIPLTIIPGFGQSEIVIIHPEKCVRVKSEVPTEPTKLVVFCTVPVLNRPLLGVNDIDPYRRVAMASFRPQASLPRLTDVRSWVGLTASIP